MVNRSVFQKLIRFALAFVVTIGVIAVTPLKSVMITTKAADSGSIGDISWQRVGNTLKIGPTNEESGTLERCDGESDTDFKTGVLCEAEGEEALIVGEGTLHQNENCLIGMDQNGIGTFFTDNTSVEPAYEMDGSVYTTYFEKTEDPEPLTLDSKNIYIVVGSSKLVTTSVKPVYWRTLNDIIAVVEQNGEVTGRRPGKTHIEARSSDGQIAICFVNVLFTDVAESSLYYFEPVYWAVNYEITNGYRDSDGMIRTFKPENNCTREAVVTFLWRLAGRPEPFNLNSPFSDVQDRSKYYYKAVLWASEKGITKGYADGTFKPDAACLREHVVTFLWRYANQPAPKTSRNPFNDVTASDYYYKAALWANEKGIAKGYSSGPHTDGFGPKLDCLREHVVTFLYRYAK